MKKIDFKKKTILITGASGYLGRKLIADYLKLGAYIIAVDKNKFKKKNKRISYFNCDLSIHKDRISLCKNICSKFKKIDIIINNASYTGDNNIIGWNTKFENHSYHATIKAFEVSVFAVLDIIKSLIKLLRKSSNPKIINISSIYSKMAPDFNLYKGLKMHNPIAYGSAKAALDQITKYLTSICGPKINVNSILPGGIKRSQNKKFMKRYIEKTPLKRMATEQDISNAVIFFSSDMSNYITGQSIVIDGGYSIT